MTRIASQRVGARVYRVLSHEGPWDDSLTEAFRRQGCTGLHWSIKRVSGTKSVSLDQLLDLPGLAYLWLEVPATDDSVVGELVGLEALMLLTRGSSPLDLSHLTSLRRADLDDRPGLTGLARSVEEFSLARFDGRDLRWLENLTQLRSVKLEGRGQTVSLAGMPELPELARLWLDRGLVETGGSPLALPRLQHATFFADRPGDVGFDAAVFRHCNELRTLRIRGPRRFKGLTALASLPELESVAVIAPTPPADGPAVMRYVEWQGGRGH